VKGIGGFITDYDSRDLLRFTKRESVSIEVRCVLDVPRDVESADVRR